jgi:hypothetical protein
MCVACRALGGAAPTGGAGAGRGADPPGRHGGVSRPAAGLAPEPAAHPAGRGRAVRLPGVGLVRLSLHGCGPDEPGGHVGGDHGRAGVCAAGHAGQHPGRAGAADWTTRFEIGDWVRLDDISGRWMQIQWRFTALRTRNGEKVVIPNAQLMKGKFASSAAAACRGQGQAPLDLVQRRRVGQPGAGDRRGRAGAGRCRHPNVARQPPPVCVALDFAAGAVRYALRYWLVDPRDDDTTDSAVRVHLLAALQRQRLAAGAARPGGAPGAGRTSARAQAAGSRNWHGGCRCWRPSTCSRRCDAGRAAAHRRAAGVGAVRARRRGHAPGCRGALAVHVSPRRGRRVYWELPDGERRLLTRLPAGQHLRRDGPDDRRAAFGHRGGGAATSSATGSTRPVSRA